jgi:hypothetical protein
MASVKRVENQIANVEQFDVAFTTEDGRDLRSDRAGIPSYSNKFENKAPGKMTVEGWKERRFRPVYPGFEVEIIMADGSLARGNTRLETVRASYEDDD